MHLPGVELLGELLLHGRVEILEVRGDDVRGVERLADLDLGLVSHLQAERREGADGRDLARQRRIDGRVVRLRVVLEVNALASAGDARRTTRFWYMPSAPYGVNGAVSFASVTRHRCSVAYALRLSASRPLFQKRLRLRRTYQLESASTKATSFCVAP